MITFRFDEVPSQRQDFQDHRGRGYPGGCLAEDLQEKPSEQVQPIYLHLLRLRAPQSARRRRSVLSYKPVSKIKQISYSFFQLFSQSFHAKLIYNDECRLQ